MGTKPQIEYFQGFQPDIAVLPELKESNIEALNPSSYVWITNNHQNSKPKGLGVLAFNGIELISLPRDEEMEIYIPLEIKSPELNFNLLAVWNFYWACKQGRFKNLRGEDCLEWSAIKRYADFLKDPALMVGDWNFGPKCYPESFARLSDRCSNLGLKSLYHEFNTLPLEETNHPTFKTTRNNFHHIDHIFGSSHFFDSMTNLTVGSFDDVVLSDHTPLFLETK